MGFFLCCFRSLVRAVMIKRTSSVYVRTANMIACYFGQSKIVHFLLWECLLLWNVKFFADFLFFVITFVYFCSIWSALHCFLTNCTSFCDKTHQLLHIFLVVNIRSSVPHPANSAYLNTEILKTWTYIYVDLTWGQHFHCHVTSYDIALFWCSLEVNSHQDGGELCFVFVSLMLQSWKCFQIAGRMFSTYIQVSDTSNNITHKVQSCIILNVV